jgi:hypothetical protein
MAPEISPAINGGVEALLDDMVIVFAMLQDPVDGRAKERPDHVRDILLKLILELLGQSYDLGAVKQLRGRQVCPSLRIGWALQNVEKGIRDTVFIG